MMIFNCDNQLKKWVRPCVRAYVCASVMLLSYMLYKIKDTRIEDSDRVMKLGERAVGERLGERFGDGLDKLGNKLGEMLG
jgi:hypothetical protein